MGSLERKLQRKKEKQAKKDMKQKMGLFDKLENECLTCQRPFDKKSKEPVYMPSGHAEDTSVVEPVAGRTTELC